MVLPLLGLLTLGGSTVSKGPEQCQPFPFTDSQMPCLINNTMWETWLRSLGWENPLEEVTAAHSSILAWRISMDRGAWRATVHGAAKSQTQLSV